MQLPLPLPRPISNPLPVRAPATAPGVEEERHGAPVEIFLLRLSKEYISHGSPPPWICPSVIFLSSSIPTLRLTFYISISSISLFIRYTHIDIYTMEKGYLKDEPSPVSDPLHDGADRAINYRDEVPLENLHKSFWQRLWPVFACGAGLFSDGYLQSVCDAPNSFTWIPSVLPIPSKQPFSDASSIL